MPSLMSKLRHAFAVESSGMAEPTPEQQVPVDWMCRQISKRHLTTPGLLTMEMCRPLNFLAAQGLYYLEPAMWAWAPKQALAHYRDFASFLEKRGSIPYICRRLEEFEHQFEDLEEKARADLQEDEHDDD
jgi:hypothetical protein